MARLSDIIQTGIRKEDLHDEEGNDPPEWVEKLIRIVNTGLRSTYNVLTPGVSQGGIGFGDNFKCNVVTAKFSHGVATTLSLGTLTSAKGCLVLGADKGNVVIANKLQGSTQAGQVKLTLWFADPSVTGSNVTVLLLPEGTLGTAAPVFPQAWIAMPYAVNWGDYGGNNIAGGYTKDAFGWVHLRGLSKSAINPATSPIATLPTGYRPSLSTGFSVANWNGATFVSGTVNIAPDGSINQWTFANGGAGTSGIAFDGITFDTR